MKATKTKAKRRNPTAKELAAEVEGLRRKLRLRIDTWIGFAAHQELAGKDSFDAGICALRNCAGDVEGLIAESRRDA